MGLDINRAYGNQQVKSRDEVRGVLHGLVEGDHFSPTTTFFFEIAFKHSVLGERGKLLEIRIN